MHNDEKKKRKPRNYNDEANQANAAMLLGMALSCIDEIEKLLPNLRACIESSRCLQLWLDQLAKPMRTLEHIQVAHGTLLQSQHEATRLRLKQRRKKAKK